MADEMREMAMTPDSLTRKNILADKVQARALKSKSAAPVRSLKAPANLQKGKPMQKGK